MRFILCLLLLLPLSIFGKIYEISSVAPLWEEVNAVTENTLVIFDVDDTLIVCKDQILRPKARRFFNAFIAQIIKEMSQEELNHLISVVCLDREIDLIEPMTPALVSTFQKQGSKVIALTAMRTGKIGLISSMEQWREEELIDHGYVLSHAFPELPYMCFTQFEEPLFPPTYYKGIISSSTISKGEVLLAFLEKSGFHPDRVIFADDKLKQLLSVQAALAKIGIPFTGYHYTAAYDLPGELDENIGNFQLQYLLQNDQWLSDEEAKKFLNTWSSQ